MILQTPDVAPQKRLGQEMFKHSVITASAGRDSQPDARARKALWFCYYVESIFKTLVFRAG